MHCEVPVLKAIGRDNKFNESKCFLANISKMGKGFVDLDI